MNRNFFLYSMFFFICLNSALASSLLSWVNDTKCNNKICVQVGFIGWNSRVAAMEMRDRQSGEDDWHHFTYHECPCMGVCIGELTSVSFNNNVWHAEGWCTKGDWNTGDRASLYAQSYDGQHWQWTEGE